MSTAFAVLESGAYMFERLIAFQASQRPDAIAIETAIQQFTYSDLAVDIARCAHWLTRLDLPVGARALLNVQHPYLHWVLTFGLEAVGVVTAATAAAQAVPGDLTLLKAEVLFSGEVPLAPVGVPHHVIDAAWLRALEAYPLTYAGFAAERRRTLDDPCRIVVTSGTTGTRKKILLTRGMIDRRTTNSLLSKVFTKPNLRAISNIGVGSIGGFMLALACWALGGTLCHHDDSISWAESLARLKIDVFLLAPYHLQQLLRALPDDFAPHPDLTLCIGGGSLSKPLAADARQRLSRNILVSYGATETGSVALGHLELMAGGEEAAGFVFPWADVEVLSPEGKVLPPGQIGEIRIRGDELVDGYLDNPEGSEARFRDGWFWPGDLGAVSAAGVLQVMGRTDDLMNIGGSKFLAGRLEALVLRVEGVLDAAAFVAPDEQQLDAPYVAYVANDDLDLTPLRMIFTQSLGREARLLRVSEIPRNAMGKIRRDVLRGQLAESKAA